LRVRRARRAKGITQEQLALAANLDRSFVSGFERGEFNVSILVLAKLARVLDVDLGALIENE
jgi:transcriptional regulator with XRE-family HTH domain